MGTEIRWPQLGSGSFMVERAREAFEALTSESQISQLPTQPPTFGSTKIFTVPVRFWVRSVCIGSLKRSGHIAP